MTNPVRKSSIVRDPFTEINRAIRLFELLPLVDRTYKAVFERIIALRDILHVRDNLGNLVILGAGKQKGEILIALTKKTIHCLQMIAQQRYMNRDPSRNLSDYCDRFNEIVETYAETEAILLGQDSTWLPPAEPPAQTEKEQLCLIASIYDSLQS